MRFQTSLSKKEFSHGMFYPLHVRRNYFGKLKQYPSVPGCEYTYSSNNPKNGYFSCLPDLLTFGANLGIAVFIQVIVPKVASGELHRPAFCS